MATKEAKVPKKSNLVVEAPLELRRGVYANVVNIKSNPNEFILDFILADGPTSGTLVSRVVISRKHAKIFKEVLSGLLK